MTPYNTSNNGSDNYEIEFDELVGKYNNWLLQGEQKINKNAFLEGFKSIFNIGGLNYNKSNPTELLAKFHPLYGKNLSSQQIDLIQLASDWKRVDAKLEDIISGKIIDSTISKDQATQSKSITIEIYTNLRNIYVSEKEHK